ncbi:GNAT family N-acetyltransferase [Leptothrix discophora]|uniref:GNAT family N-acetyltransferase n=1 Tax=Leptothrix discophora TaxID=89 RepID=A0ABT9G288_LEPDI|nr:GNAT family N-acetyltransferase [Leptothrix discophora]MDP4300582.1 GNAT family N-acetyltransferase [Leptothrix discophora]
MSALPAFSDTGMFASGAAVRVRAARIRDWPRLQGLIAEVFPDVDQSTIGHWLCDERHKFAVAFTESGLAGLVRLQVHPGERITEVSALGVLPTARGQGVARALMNYCEEVACACGAPSLELELPAEARDTQAFFQHLGFVTQKQAGRQAQPGSARWVRRAPVPVWPDWELRREHAPRVPPATLHRLAMRALYGAWMSAARPN